MKSLLSVDDTKEKAGIIERQIKILCIGSIKKQ